MLPTHILYASRVMHTFPCMIRELTLFDSDFLGIGMYSQTTYIIMHSNSFAAIYLQSCKWRENLYAVMVNTERFDKRNLLAQSLLISML